jgi:hypothetical protein
MKHGRNLLGLRCDVRMMHDATWKARRSGTRTKRGEPSSFFTSFFEDDCPRDLSTSPVTSLKHETSVMQHKDLVTVGYVVDTKKAGYVQ